MAQILSTAAVASFFADKRRVQGLIDHTRAALIKQRLAPIPVGASDVIYAAGLHARGHERTLPLLEDARKLPPWSECDHVGHVVLYSDYVDRSMSDGRGQYDLLELERVAHRETVFRIDDKGTLIEFLRIGEDEWEERIANNDTWNGKRLKWLLRRVRFEHQSFVDAKYAMLQPVHQNLFLDGPPAPAAAVPDPALHVVPAGLPFDVVGLP